MVILHIHQILFPFFFFLTLFVSVLCLFTFSCKLLPQFPLSPPALSSQVVLFTNLPSSWWLPEVNKGNPEHTVFFGNMMPEFLGERWKLSQSGHLKSCGKKKNCLEFITISLVVDYGFIQKLNLHQINRMKDKMFSQPVNVFTYM